MIKAASSFSSLIILAAASCGIVTAQTTQRLTATKANEYALVYSLPVTRLNVTIEAEITVKKPGEFYKYAKKYLNIDNPITQESHSATLKSATVTTNGMPDPDRRYAVQFKSGTAPYCPLGANGVPLAINTEKTMSDNAPELPVAHPAPPTPLETPAARQVVSEEMAQSQSTAKRAELAAASLFAIRQPGRASPSSSPRPSRPRPTANRCSSCSTTLRHRNRPSWPCLSAQHPRAPT